MAEANTESGHFLIGPPVDTSILTRETPPTHGNRPSNFANCEHLRDQNGRHGGVHGHRRATGTVAAHP
jgi:hypothetical protein